MKKSIIIFVLFFCLGSRGQTTSSIFFDLPFNSSSSDIISAIKTNTIFHIDTIDAYNKIYAWLDNRPQFLPKTRKYLASVQLDTVNGGRDTSRQQSKYLLSVLFTYSKGNSFHTATNAFKILHEIISKEYPFYFDVPKKPYFEKNPWGITRSYYKKYPTDSDLNLDMRNHVDKNTWTIKVFNGLIN